ncbi:MAG: transcriptional repressor [Peptococcaceae bacterium]|nr:transcriptional repressor [Peptococcaceae bacterium]
MQGERALERLRKNGYKITPQRQEILKAFLDGDRNLPQSAEDIHRRVLERYPNISLDTVYRNLNILHDLEIISRLHLRDGRSRYHLNTGSHHHHLVCLKCGSAEAIDFCPFEAGMQKRIAEEKDFDIREHSFEIFGYCNLCRGGAAGLEKQPQDKKNNVFLEAKS